MKRTSRFFAKTALILCLSLLVSMMLFTACSNGSKPSSNLIRNDMKEKLANSILYSDLNINITGIETILSKTEGNIYYANILLKGKTKQAKYSWDSEVQYEKYDQGWVLKDCRIGDLTCEVTKYPNEGEMKQLLKDASIDTNMKKGEWKHSGNTITYTAECEANWSEFAKATAVVTHTWEFKPSTCKWEYLRSTTISGDFTMLASLEGKWYVFGQNGNLLTISNLSANRMDVLFNGTTYRFQIQKGSIEWNHKGRQINIQLKCDEKRLSIELPDGKRQLALNDYDGILMDIWDNGDIQSRLQNIVLGKNAKIGDTNHWD